MKYSFKNAISLNWKATSIRVSIWKKIEDNGILYSSRNKTFFKYWSRSNCNNGFQKNLNERILFPVNRKSFATDCNQERIRLKDISKRWKNCFQWKGCLRYWNEMVSTSRKIRFHWPEWRICFKNTFSLDEKKTVINVWCLHKSLAETSEKLIKKTVSTCQKITFH